MQSLLCQILAKAQVLAPQEQLLILTNGSKQLNFQGLPIALQELGSVLTVALVQNIMTYKLLLMVKPIHGSK